VSRSRTDRRADEERVADSPLSAAAFEALYPRLRRYAAIVGDADIDPDDLVQDAVAAYLRRFAGSSGAEDAEAYLKTAILGLARNHRRDSGRRRRLAPPPERSAVDDRYPSDTAAVLDDVGIEDRALLVLVDIEGHRVAHAAALVGVSVLAARARLSRARRRLRDRIEAGELT
jgi:RNA polymerase sigma-70 factor (ECF subfamily)